MSIVFECSQAPESITKLYKDFDRKMLNYY
jgi:hypothetical protein